MIKQITLAVLGLVISSSASAVIFDSFEQLTGYINKYGPHISVKLDFKLCQTDYPIQVDAIAVIEPQEYILVKDKHLVFALTHTNTYEPRYPGVPVIESSHHELTPDNNYRVSTTIYNAKTYQQIGQASHLTCKLNHGVVIYSKG